MTDGLDRCPTPWCGPKHEKYTWQGPDDLFCVICDGCQVEGPHCKNEGDAQDAWNTRTTSLAAQDLVDCETCCGNGEVVTDWERYKHPHDGDVGDEAVADCPDCDGNGKIEVPSLAAQDGLVEALERCAQIVEQWNHRQNEKVDDIKYIVRNALSAIKGDKS